MKWGPWAWGVGAWLFLLACGSGPVFVCDSDESCTGVDGSGMCQQQVGYCSFADALCPSGQRFGTHAGEGFAHACVDLPPPEVTAGTTSSRASSETSQEAPMSTGDAVPEITPDVPELEGSSTSGDASEGITDPSRSCDNNESRVDVDNCEVCTCADGVWMCTSECADIGRVCNDRSAYPFTETCLAGSDCVSQATLRTWVNGGEQDLVIRALLQRRIGRCEVYGREDDGSAEGIKTCNSCNCWGYVRNYFAPEGTVSNWYGTGVAPNGTAFCTASNGCASAATTAFGYLQACAAQEVCDCYLQARGERTPATG